MNAQPPWRQDSAVFAAALALLLLNIGAACLPLSPGLHLMLTALLAVSQATLVLLLWMDLAGAAFMIRCCVVIPAAWLVLLLGLALADWATRTGIAPPW